MFIVPGSAVGILLVCAGMWWIIQYFDLFSPKEKHKDSVKDDFTPSTFVSSNVVEEVVSDISDSKDKLKQRGILDLSYEELSPIEKINYEIHYAKMVCDLLTRTVLPSVDFSSIKVDSFNTFYGVGVSNLKDKVVALFEALKKEKIEIQPKPQTKITKRNGGYRFTILCKTGFGLNLEAPFLLDAEDIIDYEELDIVVKRFIDVADDNRVNITSKPYRIGTSFFDDYRRFRYRLSAVSSYNNFVNFINSLYKRQIPCAFEKFKLTALGENSLEIDADIIFTTAK